MTKRYRTRDGNDVRIDRIDAGGIFPVRGTVLYDGDEWEDEMWTDDGREFHSDGERGNDLIEVTDDGTPADEPDAITELSTIVDADALNLALRAAGVIIDDDTVKKSNEEGLSEDTVKVYCSDGTVQEVPIEDLEEFKRDQALAAEIAMQKVANKEKLTIGPEGVRIDDDAPVEGAVMSFKSDGVSFDSMSLHHAPTTGKINTGSVKREPTQEGVKFDNDKTRYDLLPPEFLEGTARVLTFGAAKYGDRNWELGMKWSRPFAALQRHIWAWWSGEDNDPETGMSHLWHAACCIAFLAAYEARGDGDDDRPEKGGA